MSDHYETDILIWSEEQAALLRRLAKGEHGVNEQVDWDNVIDEVESVGSEQLHAVESLLRQALVHMLKVDAWPNSREVPQWRSEARRFRFDAADRFAPSMRQRIDMEKLYRQARRLMPGTIDGQLPPSLPQKCPVTLDELLSEDD